MLATFQNLVKPFVGAGILALPAAFKEGGLIASVCLMATMALMANYCIRCLLQCLQQATETGYLSPKQVSAHRSTATNSGAAPLLLSPLVDSTSSSVGHVSLDRITFNPYSVTAPPTFRDIGDLAFGGWGKYAVDVSLVMSQLGFCTAYVAFIGENMNGVFPSIASHHFMLMAMGLLAVLCQIRQVSTIAFTSALGNLIYLVSIIIIFVDGARNECCMTGRDKTTGEELVLLNLTGLPFVFGTACFALEGIGLILPVKAAMRDADQHRFYFLLNSAVALVATAYIVFGSLGYLFYGPAVNPSITANLSPGVVSDAVRVSLCLSLFFSYILQMFPVVDISDYAVYCAMRTSEEAEIDQHNRANRGKPQAVEDGEREEEEEDEATGNGDSHHAATAGPTSSSSSLTPPSASSSSSSSSSRPVSSSSMFASARTPHLTLSMIAVQCAVRAGWVGLTALVAIVVSNFGFVVSLTGSLANSLIAFILPALFYLRLVVHAQHPSPLSDGWTSVKGYILPTVVVVSGVCASFVGVWTAISAEITSSKSG